MRRESNPADGRSAFTALTDSGRHRFRETAPTYLAAIEAHFAARLSDAELAGFVDVLRRVRQ